MNKHVKQSAILLNNERMRSACNTLFQSQTYHQKTMLQYCTQQNTGTQMRTCVLNNSYLKPGNQSRLGFEPEMSDV